MSSILNAAVAQCPAARASHAYSRLFIYALTHLHIFVLCLERPFVFLALIYHLFQDSPEALSSIKGRHEILSTLLVPLLCVLMSAMYILRPSPTLPDSTARI